MRISKRYIKVIAITSMVFAVSITGVVAAVQAGNKGSSSLASIAEECKGGIDTEGFGHSKIGSVHIKEESIRLTVPCIVEIEEGSSLQLTKITVESNNLFITTKNDAKKPVHFTINNSTFKSVNGGFQVQLKTAGSSIAIKDSNFDYPLSVGVALGAGDDDDKVNLQINGSSFYSSSKNSEGIVIATTGQASFMNNKFKLDNPDETPLLVAAHCQEKNNGNAIVHCQ